MSYVERQKAYREREQNVIRRIPVPPTSNKVTSARETRDFACGPDTFVSTIRVEIVSISHFLVTSLQKLIYTHSSLIAKQISMCVTNKDRQFSAFFFSSRSDD